MTLTPDERKTVGDAWGKLAGVVVDACKSHHECHCDTTPTKPILPGMPRETTRVTISKTPCIHSAGPHNYEAMVAVPPTTATMSLAVSEMHELDAGKAMSTVPVGAAPEPSQLPASAQSARIKVGVEAVTPPGLYVGHVGPATGAQPQVPVIIFIDGLD